MGRFGLVGAALLGLAMCLPAQAQRPVWEAAGTLNCDVSGGIGFVVGSQRQVNCLFTPSYPAPPEQYIGTITKMGLDIGFTGGGQLVWGVQMSTSRRRGALAGNYAGASPEATVGAGLGANVLVGGSDRSVALQPLSIQGQVGLNVAAGIAEIALQFVRETLVISGVPKRRDPAIHIHHLSDLAPVEIVRSGGVYGFRARRCAASWNERPFHLPVARSPETISSRNQQTADRGSSAGGRRTWQETAPVPRVPDASHWWAPSRAARPRCLKRFWRAPARSRGRGQWRPARRSAMPLPKHVTTR